MARAVTARYVDPLAAIWLACAARIGLRVVRSPDAYAATDGAGTLTIGTDATLDADDSLAQMIFHELCHSLVEGEDAFARPDWGMDNVTDVDFAREHACLRAQAVLCARHGLAGLFAPTTEFRAFWDRLPARPLADRADPSVALAIAAVRRADKPPWAPFLGEALAATARIAGEAARALAAPPRRGIEPAAAPMLWAAVTAPPAPHPTGLPAGPADGATCGGCAWRVPGKPGRPDRCRQAATKIDPAWAACERFEAALDCQTCGACCRAAYHAVDVARRDPAVKARPDYIVDHGHRLELRRAGDRCAALVGGDPVPIAPPADLPADPDLIALVAPRTTTSRYQCVIYDDRPRTCRDFTLGSEHCLTARRRVGLSL
jgi:Fe-S-cluster containining protein